MCLDDFRIEEGHFALPDQGAIEGPPGPNLKSLRHTNRLLASFDAPISPDFLPGDQQAIDRDRGNFLEHIAGNPSRHLGWSSLLIT